MTNATNLRTQEESQPRGTWDAGDRIGGEYGMNFVATFVQMLCLESSRVDGKFRRHDRIP
jgi:hypothetical protein